MSPIPEVPDVCNTDRRLSSTLPSTYPDGSDRDPDEGDKLIVEVNLEQTRARTLLPNEKDWQDCYNEFKTS